MKHQRRYDQKPRRGSGGSNDEPAPRKKSEKLLSLSAFRGAATRISIRKDRQGERLCGLGRTTCRIESQSFAR